MTEETWPSWRYGPKGEARVFNSADEVPKGWKDHQSPAPDPFDRDGDGEAGGDLPDSPPSLTGKNKAELQAIATAEGVEFTEDATNAELRDAIEAKRA